MQHQRSAVALLGEPLGGLTGHLEHVVQIAFHVGEQGVGFLRQAGFANHLDGLSHVWRNLGAHAIGRHLNGGHGIEVRFAGFRVDRHFLSNGITVNNHNSPFITWLPSERGASRTQRYFQK